MSRIRTRILICLEISLRLLICHRRNSIYKIRADRTDDDLQCPCKNEEATQAAAAGHPYAKKSQRPQSYVIPFGSKEDARYSQSSWIGKCFSMWCRFVDGILLRNGYRLLVTSTSDGLPVNGFRESSILSLLGTWVH